ncbi:MAG: sigma-70 family RNA polymerase sigma factor [Planctomycetota bacterium]
MSETHRVEMGDLLQHVGWVRALARRLARDAAEADDITQDALVSALARPPSTDRDPRPWLGRVLGNALRIRRRGERRRQHHERRATPDPATERDAYGAALLEQLERQKQLARLVRDLPQPYRTVILARYYRGESTAETARRTGVSAGTLRSQLARGLELLRRRLVEQEGSADRARAALAIAALGPSSLLSPAVVAGAASIVLLVAATGVFGWRSQPEAQTPGATPASLGAAADAPRRDAATPPRPLARGGPTPIAVAAGNARTAVGRTPVLGLNVEVVAAENGAALPHARVWVLPPGAETPIERELDAQGRGTFTQQAPGAQVAAWTPGRRPAYAAAPEPDTPLRLALGQGRVLSGRVHLPDQPATDDAPLLIVPYDRKALADWPAALRDAVVARVPGLTRAPLALDAANEFRLASLPPDWAGRLVAGNGFQLVACHPDLPLQPADVVVRQPIEGLTLEVQSTPVMRGTAVWSDTRAPVTEGVAAVAVLYANGQKSYITNRPLDEAGTFAAGVFPYAAPYDRPGVQSVQVDVHPEGGAHRSVLLAPPPPTGTLAPIVVQRVADVHVVVTDPAGGPVAGALVAGRLPRDHGQYRKYVRTDTAGRAQLRNVPDSQDHVTVGAGGYAVQKVSIARRRGRPDAPLQVTLTPTNALELEVIPHGIPLDGLRVVLTHEGPLLDAEGDGNDVVRNRVLQMLGCGNGSTPGQYQHGCRDDENVWVLCGLRPARPLTVEVREAHGQVLATRSLVGPGPQETRRVTIEVSGRRIRAHGAVVGLDGRGIAEARVVLEWPTLGTQWLASTRDDGTFAADLTAVPGRTARAIRVEAPGLATRRVELADGLASGDLGTIVLEPARVLEVRTREPSGRERTPEGLAARVPGGYEVAGQFLDGRHRLAGLPSGPLTVRVTLGGRAYARDCAAPDSPLIIDVPPHGELAFEVGPSAPNFYPATQDIAQLTALGDPSFRLQLRVDQPVRRPLLPGIYALSHAGTTQRLEIRADEITRVRLPPTDRTPR